MQGYTFIFVISIGNKRARNVSLYSVTCEQRHSLHSSVVKVYDDGLVTCSWHQKKFCEHKSILVKALDVSLTKLIEMHDKNFKDKEKSGKLAPMIVKPLSTLKVPVPIPYRFVYPFILFHMLSF